MSLFEAKVHRNAPQSCIPSNAFISRCGGTQRALGASNCAQKYDTTVSTGSRPCCTVHAHCKRNGRWFEEMDQKLPPNWPFELIFNNQFPSKFHPIRKVNKYSPLAPTQCAQLTVCQKGWETVLTAAVCRHHGPTTKEREKPLEHPALSPLHLEPLHCWGRDVLRLAEDLVARIACGSNLWMEGGE